MECDAFSSRTVFRATGNRLRGAAVKNFSVLPDSERKSIGYAQDEVIFTLGLIQDLAIDNSHANLQ